MTTTKLAYEELKHRVKELTEIEASRNTTTRIFDSFADVSIGGLGVADLDGKITFAERFIQKPFDMVELSKAISRALEEIRRTRHRKKPCGSSKQEFKVSLIMAMQDDETLEMDMPPEEARRLLGSLDEKSEDLDKPPDNFPEPLKVRAKGIYDRLKKVYTDQVSLDDWYGGFAVSTNPEKDIEGWEWIADEYEKRKKKSFLRSSKSIIKKVIEESKKNGQRA